jgi:hypothetical protein
MGTKKDTFYFAVGSDGGPRSSIWRVWWSKEGDVYVAARSLGGIIKASFHHTSNVRHIAFQNDFLNWAPLFKIGERTLYRWYRTHWPNLNVSLESIIYIPTDDLRSSPVDEKLRKNNAITWIEPPASSMKVDIAIMIQDTDPGDNWPGRNRGTKLLRKTNLGDGQVLWITCEHSEDKRPENYAEAAGPLTKGLSAANVKATDTRIILIGETAFSHQSVRYMADYATDRLLAQ